MEKRKARLIVNRGGSGSSTFRATLPTNWIREMGLNEDVRDIMLSYNGNKIIVEIDKEETI